MSKGNVLLGYARGSVGDVTFARSKGQQIAHARNRQPANPKTLKQCFARGRFAAAVKFFTRGRQALYKFAFEDKKVKESDYNAFMRHNVKICPAISKAAFDNADYPVVAAFMLSKGSLQPIAYAMDSDAVKVELVSTSETTAPTTIGELSTILITNENYLPGDIVTIVFLTSSYNADLDVVAATGSGVTKWDIRQFIVDVSSTDTIASVTGMTAAIADGVVTLNLAADTAPLNGAYNAFAAIHSRNVSNGLKTSTQALVLDSAAADAYSDLQADAYKQAVAAAWQAANTVDIQPSAILQGSIAYDS